MLTYMIKAVIFDCFGVLLQRDGHESYKTLKDKDVQHRINRLEKDADLGEITEKEFNRRVAELTDTTPAKVLAETTKYQRNEDLLQFVDQLRDTLKVSMLTNVSSHTISRFFTKDELKNMFDDVVVSSEVGLVKPDPEIFALAARRLALRPEECIFVDDTALNCKAAAESGIQGIAYMGNTHTIKTINMLLAYDQSSNL